MTDQTDNPQSGQTPAPHQPGIRTGILSSRIGAPVEGPISGPAPRPAKPAPSMPAAPPPSPPAPPRPIPAPDPGRWSVRGAVVTGLLAIVVLLGGFTLWAMQSRIAGAVVASGQVEVEQQRQIVQHPDGGVVEEILVKDGQTVQAGQTLIRLDGNLLRTEHAIVEGQYFEILARRGRLEAERADSPTMQFPPDLLSAAEGSAELQDLIDGQSSLFETRRDTLRQSIEQLEKQSEQVRQQVDGIDAQIAALDRQRALIGEELEDQQSLLDRGLAQASRVLALQREAASLDGQLGELKASRAAAETRQTELDIQRLRLGSERREEAETELRDLGYRELELAERRRGLIEQINRLDIRAPAAGIVYNMQITTPRSVIRPADPVLYVIPQDRPLVIGARLATINVDEVQAGQPVVLRFSAFSSRTTPEIDGVLGRVSADALIDEATQMPYYRAEVTIPAEQLAKLGDLALIPGMPVEVFIQTGERSPMAYLVKPLADYFNRAFRES
ncbi:HlyD family type I secretion periplasmic adaptor subunit [Paracoccus sediminis]|uniref:Membrane fusion protein (MFP) family protein n=2 Tax=Paracoccus sediminis TaxID=1214787 RepID=A0A238VY62_9RHOB|nr:HlyD family type I secretion periplasmic adaptor subunit [Paracoccus sediminis]TBN51409.1 HlyD family type I secretion periplasmic adaptor subunit [Paracoccus sediminis]SNR39240.1 HlyD family secretion protein [Paracoccus sediminis]